MEEMINIEMSQEMAENLKIFLQDKIYIINKEIDKYSKIIANYLTNPNYKYLGCTIDQAMNCGKKYGQDLSEYGDILDVINKYISE